MNEKIRKALMNYTHALNQAVAGLARESFLRGEAHPLVKKLELAQGELEASLTEEANPPAPAPPRGMA